jgi:outer membrane protein
VLLGAATAYMNLLQTAALLELRTRRQRAGSDAAADPRSLQAGEVTRTDVAQADPVSPRRSQLSLAGRTTSPRRRNASR